MKIKVKYDEGEEPDIFDFSDQPDFTVTSEELEYMQKNTLKLIEKTTMLEQTISASNKLKSSNNLLRNILWAIFWFCLGGYFWE